MSPKTWFICSSVKREVLRGKRVRSAVCRAIGGQDKDILGEQEVVADRCYNVSSDENVKELQMGESARAQARRKGFEAHFEANGSEGDG